MAGSAPPKELAWASCSTSPRAARTTSTIASATYPTSRALDYTVQGLLELVSGAIAKVERHTVLGYRCQWFERGECVRPGDDSTEMLDSAFTYMRENYFKADTQRFNILNKKIERLGHAIHYMWNTVASMP